MELLSVQCYSLLTQLVFWVVFSTVFVLHVIYCFILEKMLFCKKMRTKLYWDFTLQWFLCGGHLTRKFQPDRFSNFRSLKAGSYCVWKLFQCFTVKSCHIIQALWQERWLKFLTDNSGSRQELRNKIHVTCTVKIVQVKIVQEQTQTTTLH